MQSSHRGGMPDSLFDRVDLLPPPSTLRMGNDIPNRDPGSPATPSCSSTLGAGKILRERFSRIQLLAHEPRRLRVAGIL